MLIRLLFLVWLGLSILGQVCLAAGPVSPLKLTSKQQAKLVAAGVPKKSLQKVLDLQLPRANNAASRKVIEASLSKQLKGRTLKAIVNSPSSGKYASSVHCSNPTQNLSPIYTNECGKAGAGLGDIVISTILNTLAPQFAESCNEHDKCYSHCGSDFDNCNTQFLLDNIKSCDALPDKISSSALATAVIAQCAISLGGIVGGLTCITLVKGLCYWEAMDYYQAVVALGQSAYDDAQGDACQCPDKICPRPLVPGETVEHTYPPFKCTAPTCTGTCTPAKWDTCSPKWLGCLDTNDAANKGCWSTFTTCMANCDTGCGESFSCIADCTAGCRAGHDKCLMDTTAALCACQTRATQGCDKCSASELV